jgi:hypothetical protein
MSRHLAIHGHFYQPPRENPWTETVAVEPSAAPFNDWNERITAECYRPNAHARIVDDHGLVVAIVNNYTLLGFDLAPTLAAWLERNDPHTYGHILEADAAAGTAIAHPFHHVILPLADPRDRRTEIRWGLADFRHRFGRPAEGMWLPECAVDDETLAILAEEGVRFTILSPYQVVGGVPGGTPARFVHPDGEAEVALLLFDPSLSHDIAFGPGALPPQVLATRALEGPGPLTLLATDGETFGHHHHFAERAVAYALGVEAPRRRLGTGSLAAVLTHADPGPAVTVHPSAWSCAHGLGRWSDDCGCSTGGRPGSDQRWRRHLRAALDLLRDHCHTVFETRGSAVLRDPWAARDAYVHVLLDPTRLGSFLATHLLDGASQEEALTLLEAERHALSMYTSCGWFFHDLAGIETLQVLRYAARCIDLLEEVDGEPPLAEMLEVLERARSNDPAQGNGRSVWERHVVTSRVTPARVAAHLALLDLLERRGPGVVVGGYEVVGDGHRYDDRGGLALTSGTVTLLHRRTRRVHRFVVGALRLGGGLDVVGWCRPAGGAAADEAALSRLREDFAAGAPLTTLLARMAAELGPHEFGVADALPGESPGGLLQSAAEGLADRFGGAVERLLGDNRQVFTALAASRHPLPLEVRLPVQLALARRLEADLVSLSHRLDHATLRAAETLMEEAAEVGIVLDASRVLHAAEDALSELARRAAIEHDDDAAVLGTELVRTLHHFGIHPPVQTPQEHVYRVLLGTGATTGPLANFGRALGLAVGNLGVPS